MELTRIRTILLDEASPDDLLEAALDDYSRTCASVTGIAPDAGFGAWDQDRLLDSGIAINPGAAAHCVSDYRRTVVFIRAVHAAMTRLLDASATRTVRVLYAGCGPYATLLFPIVGALPSNRLHLRLLDVHPEALDAVEQLIGRFGLGDHRIETELADASTYRCPQAPELIVTETMHKALEQEPQFAVTANLAPQLAPEGIFLPTRIDVDLCLTRAGDRLQLARVLSLDAGAPQVPGPVEVIVPERDDLEGMKAELVTSIEVFERHRLRPDDAHITGSRPCPEFAPLEAGAAFRVAFHSGRYPVFEIEQVEP